jgi:hypothetical protein
VLLSQEETSGYAIIRDEVIHDIVTGELHLRDPADLLRQGRLGAAFTNAAWRADW